MQDPEEFEWDAFLCHASEDKKSLVEPLVAELQKYGLKIWFDKFTLRGPQRPTLGRITYFPLLIPSARIRLCRFVRSIPNARAAPDTFQPASSSARRI